MSGILKQWNYDLATLQADDNIIASITQYGTMEDLAGVLGNPVFSDDGTIVSAEAFTLGYFLKSNPGLVDGSEVDPKNEEWEIVAFFGSCRSCRRRLRQLPPVWNS